MYNAEKPTTAELPSSEQLLKSTLVACLSAMAILITVVMPSEYGIDPTGVGRLLNLTEMGEIKTQLAQESAADQAADQAAAVAPQVMMAPSKPTPSPNNSVAASTASPKAIEPAPAGAQSAWRDETRFTLAPGQGIEVKMKMKQGNRAQFSWASNGGPVNFDTHGDGGGNSISYEKGRGVPRDEGELEAAFDGNHGWFWRNRGDTAIEILLRTRGDYLEIKRVI